jgi:thiol:disulfide interchange protein DsbG
MTTMHLNRLFFVSIAIITLLLGGCSKQETTGAGPAGKREVTVQAVAAEAKGFTVGALMSAHTVYVFFDPQCPHCGHLWQASTPLHKKVKFVWIPVAWINASSLTQGAALMAAANPAALMTEHEASLLAGQGGIAASSSVPSEVEQSIKANTKLLNSLGAESVPFIVVKNAVTGQTIAKDGALTTAALAEMIGVDPS